MSNLIGHSLGRYHILEQLGEGGMAVVYKAYDTRLERDVAVKVIRTEKLTIETMGKTLKRFEREAKALAKLTHPNIVPITDYGEHDGKPYLVMPYLPGGTLKQRLKGKPLPWEDSVRLLIPIARALHYAHQQGIIHRDVKPSNILITQSGEPMLTDFGIAKILLDNEETADLTGTGMGVGTPEYMSPEQFQGKGVDARTDVYSLGVVLYEMITGRKPYQADTPAAVLIKQVTEALPRPKNIITGLPDDVEKLLLKTLAKEKEDRYQNIAEMVHAMESLFGHAKVVSPSPKSQEAIAHKPEERTIDTMATIMQDEPSRDILATVAEDSAKERAAAQKPQVLLEVTDSKQEKKTTWGCWGWVIGIVVLIIGLCVGIGGWQEAQNIRAEATAEAYDMQATATEQARAISAQSTAMALQQQSTRIFGPKNGAIEHNPNDNFIASASAEVNLNNFIVEAKIHNPYSIEESPWTFAIDFRQTFTTDNAIYLYINSDGTWSLDVDSSGVWNKVDSGFIPNLDTTTNGSNFIRLIVYDEIATFYVNDVFIDVIDISGNMNSGDVRLIASLEIAGKTTQYTDFIVWELTQR